MPSKGYTSSFRGSNTPSSYYEVLGTDFGAFGSSNAQLGSAGKYSLLAYSGITNTGNSVITGGNVGSAPTTSITGFPPGAIITPAGIDNANAAAARAAGLAAYTFYAALAPTQSGLTNLSTNNGGGGAGIYNPGVFVGATSLTMPTGITLSGAGLYVFIAGSTVNLASGQSVVLTNGATAENVIWVVGSSLTTVATSNMVGTILANTSVTLGGGTLVGRALAVGPGNGAVTISAATVVTSGSVTAGIQNPLPLVPANGTADYVYVIPNTGSQWRVQKSVQWSRPAYVSETPGISLDTCDIISPVYPGASATVTAGIVPTSYMSINGYLFQATGSGVTAANFIGFSKFNLTKGATTLDGSVTWTSFGKAVIIDARYSNSSALSVTPTATEIDFFTV